MRRALLLVLALLAAPAALAGRPNVDCRHPFVFREAAVNVVVLPYRYAGEGRELSEAARRLALLVQLDVLFSLLKYGSVGAVHVIDPPQGDTCPPEDVLAQLLGQQAGAEAQAAPGGGLVLLWGRLYEEGDDLFVQSYLRFVRRDRTEDLQIRLREKPFTLRPPTQAIAFPPRHVTRAELAAIEAEFARRVVVRDRPDAAAQPQTATADLSASTAGYWVTEARGAWMKIASQGSGPAGWVEAGSDATAFPLRRKLPELQLVDGIAGYLRLRHAQDQGDKSMLALRPAVERALSAYEEADAASQDAMPRAVARSLAGILRMQPAKPGDPDVAVAERAFSAAARLVPYSAEARNADVMGRLCLAFWGPGVSVAELAARSGRSWFRGAADDLVSALALDPGNAPARANLETLYRMLLAGTTPAEPAAVKPLSREETAARLNALQATTR